MKLRKLTAIGSVLSLVVPLWKVVLTKTAQAKPNAASEKVEAQFGEQDRTGVFHRTHEDCLPTSQNNTQIEIKEDTIHIRSGSACELLARVEWKGIEGRTKWINHKFLSELGLFGCEVIYCRPVYVPGGSSLWLSYLPSKDSRSPLRDELYSRKVEA